MWHLFVFYLHFQEVPVTSCFWHITQIKWTHVHRPTNRYQLLEMQSQIVKRGSLRYSQSFLLFPINMFKWPKLSLFHSLMTCACILCSKVVSGIRWEWSFSGRLLIDAFDPADAVISFSLNFTDSWCFQCSLHLVCSGLDVDINAVRRSWSKWSSLRSSFLLY